jgi:hypothetical protein
MKGFKCPNCEYIGKAKDWNNTTAQVFESIHPLPKCGRGYIFVCPGCTARTTRENLIEVEHSVRGK